MQTISENLNLSQNPTGNSPDLPKSNDPSHDINNPETLSTETVLGSIAPQDLPQLENWNPIEDLCTYLQCVFKPDDYVRIVTWASKTIRADGTVKYCPAEKGTTYLAKKLYRALANASRVEDVIGPYDMQAGVWVGLNPVVMNGSKNSDVTEYRHILVECDVTTLEMQLAQLKASNLPISALTYSGGKSIHAIVKARIGINSPEEYKTEAEKTFTILEKFGMHPDRNCSNSARLTRLPGVIRGDQKQYFIDTCIGAKSYEEWEATVNLIQANLSVDKKYGKPYILTSMEQPKFDDHFWIVDGLLRKGQMMEIIGRSKAGKSLFALQMCLSIAKGGKFLGLDCNTRKILYCNLEIATEDISDILSSISYRILFCARRRYQRIPVHNENTVSI